MKKILIAAILGMMVSTSAMAACEGTRSNDEFYYCRATYERNVGVCNAINEPYLRQNCVNDVLAMVHRPPVYYAPPPPPVVIYRDPYPYYYGPVIIEEHHHRRHY